MSSGTWLVLGSSPSMPEFADSAFGCVDHVATCNLGVVECMHQRRPPEVYGVLDSSAYRGLGRYIRAMQDDCGTMVVTDDGAAKRGVHADLVLLQQRWKPDSVYRRGMYLAAPCSGAMILQVVLMLGAKRVVLVGMEGYRSTRQERKPDTFTGAMGCEGAGEMTLAWYGPLLQQIVDGCPDVAFVMCGDPAFPLQGRNLRWYREPERFAQAMEATSDELMCVHR